MPEQLFKVGSPSLASQYDHVMRLWIGLLISVPLISAHAPLHVSFPPLPCDYAVNQAQALSVTGDVPPYINGSLYHALFYSVGKWGGMISVNFAPTITASFGYINGPHCHVFEGRNRVQAGSNLTKGVAKSVEDKFKLTDVVTISSDPRSTKRVFSLSAVSEFAALDSRTLLTVEDPVELDGDSVGDDWQNNPEHLDIPMPRFFQPAHAPTDANGDLYGLLYIFNPKPAYRIWRLAKSSGKRTVFADVPSSQQFLDLAEPGPAYIHQCMLFTPRFIIIPEIPMRMSLPPTFDFKVIQDGWFGNKTGAGINFIVLEKKSGKVLGNFKAPSAYSWHGINAFEEGDQIFLDMTWQQNYTALDGFTNRRHAGQWWYYRGKYARYRMPSPSLDGSQAHILGRAIMSPLTKIGQPFVSPDFAVVHPGMMWRKRTRYIWGLATSDSYKDKPWLPHVIKVDTSRPDETPKSYTAEDDVRLGAPVYVPGGEQGAAEDDGSLIMLKYNISEPDHSYVVVLDATTMIERATIKLPVKPASNVGLHNHYSQYPSEAHELSRGTDVYV